MVITIFTFVFQYIPCRIYPVPFYEGFDGIAFAPGCWGLYKGKVSDIFNGTPWEETQSGWERNTQNNGLTTPHATLNLVGTECHDWITTPEIRAELTEPTLYFNVALTGHSNANPPVSQNNADDIFMVIIPTVKPGRYDIENMEQHCIRRLQHERYPEYQTKDRDPARQVPG